MLYSSCCWVELVREGTTDKVPFTISASYLSGGINYFRRKILPLVPYGFAKCIFDCWIVAIHKVAVDKLNRQRRFAYERAY